MPRNWLLRRIWQSLLHTFSQPSPHVWGSQAELPNLSCGTALVFVGVRHVFDPFVFGFYSAFSLWVVRQRYGGGHTRRGQRPLCHQTWFRDL